MGWVLKITGGLLGMLLLILTIPLWRIRDTREAEPLVIAQAYESQNYRSRLYWAALGESKFRRPITPLYDGLYHIAAVDDWLYYEAYTYVANPTTGILENVGGIYRSKAGGEQSERIIKNDVMFGGFYPTARFVPVADSIVVPLPDAQGYIHLHHISTTDGRSTPLIVPGLEISWFEVITGADGTWLLLQGGSPAQTWHIYRMRLDGSDLQDLTPDVDSANIQLWLPDENWLIVYLNQQLYRMRPDGSEQMWLGDDNDPYQIDYVADWIVGAQLLVVQASFYSDVTMTRQQILRGLDLNTGRVVWELKGYDWQGLSPDDEWALVSTSTYFIDSDPPKPFVIERMRPDGTAREVILETSDLTYVVDWTPDSQAVLYFRLIETDNFAYQQELWQTGLDKSKNPTLLYPVVNGNFAAWSADGKRMILDNEWLWLDGSGRETILPEAMQGRFVAWADFREQNWQPLAPIIGGGLLMLFVFWRARREN